MEVVVVVGVAGISERYHGRLMGVNCRGTGGRVRLCVANAARFTLCHVDDGGGGRAGDCREGLTARQSHFGQTNPPVSATAAVAAAASTADHSGCRDIWKAWEIDSTIRLKG